MKKHGKGKGAGRRRQETKRDDCSFARHRWSVCGEAAFPSSLSLSRSDPSVFLLSLTFNGREVRLCYFTARALASVSVCVYLQIRTSVLMSVAYFRVCFFMYPARKRETKMNIIREKWGRKKGFSHLSQKRSDFCALIHCFEDFNETYSFLFLFHYIFFFKGQRRKEVGMSCT